jgi:hypothetical protein
LNTMADDNKKVHNTVDLAPIRVHGPMRHAGTITRDKVINRPGRPKGSLNKITRTMKDAIVAAAEELGHIDFDKWREHLKGDPENGMKQFFKVLAVDEMRTFGIILARIMPLHVRTRPHDGLFSKDRPPKRNPGRPPGSLNKITRTMKDAIVAAAEELGHVDFDKWRDLKGDPENGMKQFFKALAVNEMRTFGIILARLIPMQAELREADLPEDIIKFMPPIDAKTIDPDEMEENPYGDPELDDEELIDVTLDKEAAE